MTSLMNWAAVTIFDLELDCYGNEDIVSLCDPAHLKRLLGKRTFTTARLLNGVCVCVCESVCLSVWCVCDCIRVHVSVCVCVCVCV